MNKTTNILRGRPWLMLLALFAWLLPQTVAADDTYVEDTSNYSITLTGSNVITIDAPLCDFKGTDTWINDGNLYVEGTGVEKTKVLHFECKDVPWDGYSNSKTEIPVIFKTEVGGYFEITQGNSSNKFKLTKDSEQTKDITRLGENHFYFSADWVLPYNLLGKELKFTWEVERNVSGAGAKKKVTPSQKTIKVPEAAEAAAPIITDAMLNPKSKGVIEIPWYLAAKEITALRYDYTDGSGKATGEDMPKAVNNGTIQLKANEPHRNFRITASYYQEGAKGKYLIEDVKTEPKNLAMIHGPVGLTARLLGGTKSKVELTWNVAYPDDEDLALTDFFEIQRSLTGKEEDFVNVGQEFFTKSSGKASYTFIDSTLVSEITANMLKSGGTLDSLTYRVRRAITKDWGWGTDNNCAASTKLVLDNLHLLRISDYTAKWEDERAYTARVSWNYADEIGGVWDNRARMILRVSMKNRDGNPVDTLTYVLNQTERQQRYKIVSLTRSCVKFDVEMFVEQGESPLNQVEQVSSAFFPIRTAQDWKTFLNKVKTAEGKYDVNARLYADISIENTVGLYETYPYRGTFDGNGHTLNVNISGGSLNNLAIFRFVDNAVFRNLYTTGTINTGQKFAGSLIGRINNGHSVIIEGCRSSVTLNNTINGDATMGGFVGLVGDSASVVFRNCKFDGNFMGDNCSHVSGYIGCCLDKAAATIDNCLFAPGQIRTKTIECATWARKYNSASLNVINSYATREYTPFLIIRSSADWTRFRDMVKDAAGDYDVNAVLDADVNAGSIMVGFDESIAYRGTFDGNGHTLTFSVPDHSRKFLAPFVNVGNATIKNLHTAGTITSSQMYPTGLVAQVINGTATIENCWSSITLKGTMDGEGTLAGIVGRVSNSKVTISNSKFDGRFEGDNCYGNGGFISWVDEKSSATITNCFFAPDRISTKTDKNETWARKDDSGTVTVTNSHYTRGMGAKFIAIRNADDWGTFHQMTEANKGKYWVDASLEADITTSLGIGVSEDANWLGTFDGNGHTLNVNISRSDGKPCAVFCYAWNANIRNLHVTGKISGGIHSAGLIGCRIGTPTINVERVWVSTEVTASSTHAAGVIGHVGAADVNMTDVRFDGKIITNNDASSIVGCIIGWGGEGGWTFHRVYNCVPSNPVANYICFCVDSSSGTGKHWGSNDKSSLTITNTTWSDWGVTAYNKSDQNEVMNLMNGEQAGSWQIVDGKAVPVMQGTDTPEASLASNFTEGWTLENGKLNPVMTSTSVTEIATSETDYLSKLGDSWKQEGNSINPVTTTFPESNFTPFPKPTLPDFYHASNGKIEQTLMTQTRQSSVLLTWDTDGNPIDYFTVYRRVKDEGEDAWKEIATGLTDMGYEDKTASPLETYEYKVRAVNDCEGVTYTETEVKVGECKHTGRVEGYVRFKDGTGVAGIPVSIIYNNVTETTVTTDASGHFEADGLSYKGNTTVTYDVQPTPANSKIKFDEPIRSSVTFNATSNDEMVHEFTVNSGKRFSGFVMFDGTSIPVKGAHFKVNGRDLYNSEGKLVETEYDGSFSFRVLPGIDTIQVVMDGHVFTGEGYYKSKAGHDFTDDVAQTYFYDATKVKLTGRVVGGNDQGKLPLGNNLSKNNLGDNLKMVLALEGDNTSWLVYDNLNPNRTERETTYQHPRGKGHKTVVKTKRKLMEVLPDSATGEYEVMLPPVRWKVQQVNCDGYPTLFQEGQVSEVIDLTDCLTPKDTTFTGSYKDVDTITVSDPKLKYHAIYNRIYHSPVELTYKQVGYDDFSYFGDKSYTATDLLGNRAVVPLAFKNPADTTQAKYTFGHPVFSLERKYYIQVQMAESYPYNNNKSTERVDYVKVGGGIATMYNGMKNTGLMYKDTIRLDEQGQGIFTLTVDQTPQLLTELSALKRVNFSVEQDGTHYEAEPLYGYVLNMFPTGAGKDILTDGQPILFDILRDPPGAYSSNTLAKGATLNYSYSMSMMLMAGVIFNLTVGSTLQNYTGTVAAPSGAGSTMGLINASESGDLTVSDFIFNMSGSKAYSYTMAIGHNISTSGDPTMVGADADLYIGAVQNLQVMPMSTIRAIPDSMYQDIKARLGKTGTKSEVGKEITYGTLVHIAEGETIDKNGKKEKFHLVRDESLGYGPKLESQFIYSQKQILEQIIPELAKQILDMMFIGTEAEAKQLANSTQFPVYLSLRQPTDPKFGVKNTKKIDDHAYNTTIKEAQDGINYLVVLPDKRSESEFKDEVAEKSEIIYAWAKMITQNEREKVTATDLVTNYDIAGAQGVNYSETFDSNYSLMSSTQFPFGKQPDYFAGDGSAIGMSIASLATNTVVAGLLGAIEAQKASTPNVGVDPTKFNKESGMKSEIQFTGNLLQWLLVPVLVSDVTGADAEVKSYNRTETFTIATDPQSHLNVDVYRVNTASYGDNQKVDIRDIYTNNNFNNYVNLVNKFLKKESKMDLNENGEIVDLGGSRSFVFRTRGGSTQNPWEGERTTHFYEAGTVLDERTLKIDNPKIWLDKQSVSGVSVGDAARFKVYIANESEKPEAVQVLSAYQLFSLSQANPNGAKITVDGEPLSTGGTTVTVAPGAVTQKTIEVRAGDGFDYEGLTIGVMSPTDMEHAVALTSFDVHFLREAGPVTIATPGDKWVLNTNAQEDKKRGWYIPVTINGFDRHQHNFDHIEFQYKESQRGDDSWVNLCSYYADSTLMANANGVRELMKPNANIVTHFFGEGTVIEKAYDLRAVLFCRNGNSFLTTPSKIVSGVKDTRRPQLFGTPEPKNGILTLGDDIVFNFSEDIEYNYLSAITNFEVKGEVNNNDISNNVSVQFTGQASLETEAKRNFSGKDITIDLMVKPDSTGYEMPLFSHGSNDQKLQLWVTPDSLLKVVVNDQTFLSDSTVYLRTFAQVAVCINQQDSTVTLFNGGKQIGKKKLNALYHGTGPLIFGRTNETNRSQSKFYQGRMMEARLWYRVMDGGLIGTTYGSKRLTGYEKDLVDYYPMDEAFGDYATDHTQGANAKLIGANWAIPRGMSLHLEKADQGVLLKQTALNRSKEQDYTLMFWFKTDKDGSGTLLSNGRGLKEDDGAENQFHIGFENGKLMYRSNGFATEVTGEWNDNQWHHYAMTVNRGRNVANIYVDKELRSTFGVDSLGGISGGYPLIGASRYTVSGNTTPQDGTSPLKGNVDELLFFAQALPQTLINTYSTKSPGGDEYGMLTYLAFDRQERQKNNDIEMVPYVFSKKLYLDDNREVRYELDPETKKPTSTPVRDYVFVDTTSVILPHVDATQAAPVVPNENVRNLKFAFIGKGNQLLVEIDETAAKLNHRNIYVTVRDVEDKNGNAMASPQTACYYVTNSSLQWMVNRLDVTIKYGSGESCELPFYNGGATSHNYTIENCPKWLTLNKYSDVVAPLTMDYVNAAVSKDLNVGTYNEILYLTDEDGITEPFYLNLTIEGEQPDWAQNVDRDLLKNSMNISGQVYLYGELDTDVRDIVGVFDNENQCHGFANISHDVQSGDNGLFLTVYDNQTSGRELNFRLWQYNTGREIVLTPSQAITFQKDAMLGTDKPVRFDGGEAFVQNFNLKKGWNWVSFNLKSDQLNDVNKLLGSMKWSNGDILTDMGSDLTLTYEAAEKQWIATGSTDTVTISPKAAYAIKVKEDCTLPIGGTVIKEQDDRTIGLSKGWNAIGYTPMTNLTVETALSDYYDQAEQGDVIKSHTEFAYFTKSGNVGRWRGSLQYMKPGEGYMMLCKGDTASFTYPYYDLSSNFREDWTSSMVQSSKVQGSRSRSTMSVSAVVEGFEVEEGDVLIAFADGEVVGSEELRVKSEEFATAQPLFYLSIAGDKQQAIWFAIERDGEIVATTEEVMTFKTNAVIGSPDEPTAISFVHTAHENGQWYTIDGKQLPKKPTQRGVYIFNNKKVMIK